MLQYSTAKYRLVTMADMGRKEKGDMDGCRWFSYCKKSGNVTGQKKPKSKKIYLHRGQL